MVGRFPILTDENIDGPLIEGLRSAGWDVVTVQEIFGQRSVDEIVFAYAADHGRVLVTTDRDFLEISRHWLERLRPFRMVFWQQGAHQKTRVSFFLAAFSALAGRENAFAAGIEYLRIGR